MTNAHISGGTAPSSVSGGVYNSTPPTVVDKNPTPLQTDVNGKLLTSTVLGAGTDLVGKVGIDQTTPGTTDSVSVKTQAYGSLVTLTRTADTAAYKGGDVIGIGTGAGNTTPGAAALTFANIGPAAGGEIMLTSASLEIDVNAIPSGMTSFRLYLYSVTPPSALVDNNAWDLPAGDRASFLDYIDFATPTDLGSTLFVKADQLQKQITLASGSLYGYLVTIGAYTPSSAAVKQITLHSIGL